MNERVRLLLERLEKVEALLSQPDVALDQKRFRALGQEYAHLAEIKEAWRLFSKSEKQLAENTQLLETERDPSFIDFIRQENTHLQQQIALLQGRLENLLVPPDP